MTDMHTRIVHLLEAEWGIRYAQAATITGAHNVLRATVTHQPRPGSGPALADLLAEAGITDVMTATVTADHDTVTIDATVRLRNPDGTVQTDGDAEVTETVTRTFTRERASAG